MINLIRKAVYVFYGKGAEERRARRIAKEAAAKKAQAQAKEAEDAAKKVEAERRKNQELAYQAELKHELEKREAARQLSIETEAALQRSLGNPFEVGGRYKNHKGYYTVVKLTKTMIRIRWDSGGEILDTIQSQQRILQNMHSPKTYCDAWSPVMRYRPTVAYCTYCGRPLTSPQYYNGLPYGSTCIKYAR